MLSNKPYLLVNVVDSKRFGAMSLPSVKSIQKKTIKCTPSCPEDLICAVSKGNSKQTGNDFGLLVSYMIIKKREDKVKSLRVILSDKLHRYYVGDDLAKEWGDVSWQSH